MCKMMRGFQIWPQSSNRITFNSLFGEKTVENLPNWVFCQFSSLFFAKKGSNVVRFEFCGQIWNPRMILHTLSHYL